MIHNIPPPVAEGDGHGVADQHLTRTHDGEVGDVHQNVDHRHHGDGDANGERQIHLDNDQVSQ